MAKRSISSIWFGVHLNGDVSHSRLIGAVRRSCVVTQCGHFCYCAVRYQGKRRDASGAEDRIYPFHSFDLEPGELPHELELIALGWCTDGNTYAYLTKDGKVVTLDHCHATPREISADLVRWEKSAIRRDQIPEVKFTKDGLVAFSR